MAQTDDAEKTATWHDAILCWGFMRLEVEEFYMHKMIEWVFSQGKKNIILCPWKVTRILFHETQDTVKQPCLGSFKCNNSWCVDSQISDADKGGKSGLNYSVLDILFLQCQLLFKCFMEDYPIRILKINTFFVHYHIKLKTYLC